MFTSPFRAAYQASIDQFNPFVNQILCKLQDLRAFPSIGGTDQIDIRWETEFPPMRTFKNLDVALLLLRFFQAHRTKILFPIERRFDQCLLYDPSVYFWEIEENSFFTCISKQNVI